MNDETFEFEGRTYVNPKTSSDEQAGFIETFRAIQEKNQGQINQQTRDLGSDVSSNLGGLTGAETFFDTQYRQPHVNAAIENLQKVRLQQAMNTAMANEQAMMQQRLREAERAYKRAASRASSGGGGTGGNGGGGTDGGIDFEGTPVGDKVVGATNYFGPDTSTVAGPTTVVDPSIPSSNIFVDEEEGYVTEGASNTGTRTTRSNKVSPIENINEGVSWVNNILGNIPPASFGRYIGNFLAQKINEANK